MFSQTRCLYFMINFLVQFRYAWDLNSFFSIISIKHIPIKKNIYIYIYWKFLKNLLDIVHQKSWFLPFEYFSDAVENKWNQGKSEVSRYLYRKHAIAGPCSVHSRTMAPKVRATGANEILGVQSIIHGAPAYLASRNTTVGEHRHERTPQDLSEPLRFYLENKSCKV